VLAVGRTHHRGTRAVARLGGRGLWSGGDARTASSPNASVWDLSGRPSPPRLPRVALSGWREQLPALCAHARQRTRARRAPSPEVICRRLCPPASRAPGARGHAVPAVRFGASSIAAAQEEAVGEGGGPLPLRVAAERLSPRSFRRLAPRRPISPAHIPPALLLHPQPSFITAIQSILPPRFKPRLHGLWPAVFTTRRRPRERDVLPGLFCRRGARAAGRRGARRRGAGFRNGPAITPWSPGRR
jgi:hypothetical protein